MSRVLKTKPQPKSIDLRKRVPRVTFAPINPALESLSQLFIDPEEVIFDMVSRRVRRTQGTKPWLQVYFIDRFEEFLAEVIARFPELTQAKAATIIIQSIGYINAVLLGHSNYGMLPKLGYIVFENENQARALSNLSANEIYNRFRLSAQWTTITHSVRANNSRIILDGARAFFERYEVRKEVVVSLRIDVINFNARASEEKKEAEFGGCTDSKSHKSYFVRKVHEFKDGTLAEIEAVAAKHNNCFFRCFPEFKLTKVKANVLRKKLSIPDDTPIPVNKMAAMCELMHVATPTILSEEKEVLIEGTSDMTLLVLDHHCYRVLSKKVLKKCEKCGRMYLNHHTEKACKYRDKSKKAWNAKKVRSQRETDGTMNIRPSDAEKKEVDLEKEQNKKYLVGHYDIETYVDNPEDIYDQKFHVSVVGFAYYPKGSTTEKYVEFYSMEEFLNFVQKPELKHLKYLNAYFGRGFDHLFLIKSAKDMGVDLKDMKIMEKSGTILKASVFGKKLIDISRHTTGSLDANLKAYKLGIEKLSIDYNKIAKWESMDAEFKSQLSKYLMHDVIGMMKLTEVLMQTTLEDCGYNILDFISCSQVCDKIWREQYLNEDVFAPNLEQETLFRKSVYGGKTKAYKSKFISSEIADIESKKISYADCKDYLLDLDVVSLYPTAMHNFEYPIGKQIKTEVFMENKIGLYEVMFTCPTDLVNPYLPIRDKTSLAWQCFSGERRGVYTNVDLEEARKRGYTFKVISGWYWEKSAPIFRDYVKHYFELKKKAPKGSPMYELCKLRLNSLYGKQIQRPVTTELKFVNQEQELWLQTYCESHKIVELRDFGDCFMVVSEPEDEVSLNRAINKPTQLGSFILSYSRKVMGAYCDRLNPTNCYADLPYYGDTDSLQVHVSTFEKSGIKLGKELGDLDLDIDGKIFEYYGIQPKLYYDRYLSAKTGSICEHFRAKGVAKKIIQEKLLTRDNFVAMDEGKLTVLPPAMQMKRVLFRGAKTTNDMLEVIRQNPSKMIGGTSDEGKKDRAARKKKN